MKLLRVLYFVVPALALVQALVPSGAAVAAADVYTTEGHHFVNGREWRTSCVPYSQTERCTTEILATQVKQESGRFVQTTDWVFNNLTYKASPRSLWRNNPLGGRGETGAAFGWSSVDGRSWRVECDTAATGNGACRSYIRSRVIESGLDDGGNRTFRWSTKWVFNNIVRFTPSSVPAPRPATPTPAPPRPAPTTSTPAPTATPVTATSTPTASATNPGALAAPVLHGTSSRTDTSISIRFSRSTQDSDCGAGIGYQVRLDSGTWADVGNFSGACGRDSIGYKFDGLAPGTEYLLGIRAVRESDGRHSPAAALVASTTGTTHASTPPVGPGSTATPTPGGTSPEPQPVESPAPPETTVPVDARTPRNLGVTNQTDTTISIGFLRPLASDETCQAHITYQVRLDGGPWTDAGGFEAACARERVGHKFDSLEPGRQYELGLRAVYSTDGSKSFSGTVTTTGSTTGEPHTTTPSPTAAPTPAPTDSPSPSASATPVPTAGPTPTQEPTPTFDPTVLSAPFLRGPVNQTTSSISIVIHRVEQSFGICQPDIFYEMRGGEYEDWYLHGTFPTAPCDDPDPGFKFSNLQPDTAYTFEVRAYRLVGASRYYSPVSTISGRTLPHES